MIVKYNLNLLNQYIKNDAECAGEIDYRLYLIMKWTK